MPKRGVTIIEVLISIGVAFVGLLGVMAVLPLAISQVNRGDSADRASRLGQNAIEIVNLHEMRDPTTWRAAGGGVVGHPNGSNAAFAIDPRFVAQNRSASPTTNYDAALFPYIDRSVLAPSMTLAVPPQPRMQRISIGPIARGVSDVALSGDNLNDAPMGRLLADQIFQAQDLLGFEFPADESLPAVQNYGGGLKRQSAGQLSWMATLAPKIDASGSFKDFYTLSIVVFRDRDAGMAMFEDLDADGSEDTGEPATGNERVAWALSSQCHGAGFGGGDMTMESLTEEGLQLRPGDWVMLMRNLPSATTFLPFFKWYRVVDTGDARLIDRSITVNQDRPGNWERDITLLGADWPVTGAAGPDLIRQNSSSPLLPVNWVAIVNNVVAVYEKTIRLETTSLWTN